MIEITRYIQDKLINTSEVTAYVDTRIFPIVIPDLGEDNKNKNPFPLIVIDRDDVTPEYAKGGCNSDTAIATVTCWSITYSEGVNIIKEVRTALERVKGTYSTITIKDCRVNNVGEGYEHPVYYQSISFSFK